MRQQICNKVTIQQLYWKERSNILKGNVEILSTVEEAAFFKAKINLLTATVWFKQLNRKITYPNSNLQKV